MVTVMLPGVRGRDAYRQLLHLAAEIKRKYDIHFDRDANDEFEALIGILKALEHLASAAGAEEKARMFINAVIAEKGEITEEGVFVWPRHMKEAAEELGIDWDELKETLKRIANLEFDRKRGKYKINV